MVIQKDTLDKWQREVLEAEGNILICSGRQVGKSYVVSKKACQFALKHPKTTTLIIASTDRQSYLLFEKVIAELMALSPHKIKRGKDKPTKHRVILKNGSTIYSLPTGLTGYGIRGFTIDLLIADECAYIQDAVWSAVTPMLATTQGNLILLSTPKGKQGFFYERSKDKTFKQFRVSSEKCERISKEYLKQQRLSMTKLQYAQEYLGEFIDDLTQFFSNQIIEENITLPPLNSGSPNHQVGREYILGVDFAGYGGDENAFVVIEKIRDRYRVVDISTTSVETIPNNITGDTIDRIRILNNHYNFKKIYVDDGGLGSPIFDFLKQLDDIKRKIIALNNARRSLDHEDTQHKKLLKVDLYGNLLNLLETHRIDLPKHNDLILSLKSIQYDYNEKGELKIFGKYTHITEALIRASWYNQNKSLNIYLY